MEPWLHDAIGQQTVVGYSNKAAGQHVLQETTQELFERQTLQLQPITVLISVAVEQIITRSFAERIRPSKHPRRK